MKGQTSLEGMYVMFFIIVIFLLLSLFALDKRNELNKLNDYVYENGICNLVADSVSKAYSNGVSSNHDFLDVKVNVTRGSSTGGGNIDVNNVNCLFPKNLVDADFIDVQSPLRIYRDINDKVIVENA